jgi:hypothetical protein
MDKKTEKELWRLHDALVEKRSDIAEILEAIINGERWRVKQVERRLVYCDVPVGADRVEYDTLTTELSFRVPSEDSWITGQNHKYR